MTNLEEAVTLKRPDGSEIRIPSVPEYVERFKTQYAKDPELRENVSLFVKLSGYEKLQMIASRAIKFALPSLYERKLSNQLTKYATIVRSEFIAQFNGELGALAQLSHLEEQQQARANEAANANAAALQTTNNLASVAKTYERQAQTIHEAARQESERKAREAADARTAAKSQFDTRKYAQEALQTALKATGLIEEDARGALKLADKHIVARLEDLFLDGFMTDLDGNTEGSFMSSMKSMFEDTEQVSFVYRQIKAVGEMGLVDYGRSIPLSRSRGFKLPQYPYLIVRERKVEQKQSLGTIGVNTAMALDASGSMFNPFVDADGVEHSKGLFPTAKQVALASSGLMRKLHPNNKSYLAVYNYGVYPTTTEELWRGTYPDGGTHTHEALNWLADTLGPGGQPGIATLVTDGYPFSNKISDPLGAAIKAAERFQKLTNVMLAIYLVSADQPDEDAKQKVRMIGEAAGSRTRFLPIPARQLGRNVLGNIQDSLSQFYTLQDF